MNGPTICFAPDYSDRNPYQSLLASALADLGHTVRPLRHYRRGLPITRGLRDTAADILHIHWPDAYFATSTPLHGLIRKLRHPLDLGLARRRAPLVLTAHNLLPHSRSSEPMVRWLCQHSFRAADAVISHGPNSTRRLIEAFHLDPARIHEIPHGDLSVTLPPPTPRAEARSRLSVDPLAPLCLMFGALAPYKGIEEVVTWWRDNRPGMLLAVAGHPHPPAFARSITRLVDNQSANIIIRPEWLDDSTLSLWLSAADCALFNYREILVSGAACLARSRGLPVLLPQRLDSLDLGEPDPAVIRFHSLDGDFPRRLDEARAAGQTNASAAAWRSATAWPHVARLTASLYSQLPRAPTA